MSVRNLWCFLVVISSLFSTGFGVNPVFDSPTSVLTILENSPPGTYVHKYTATDPSKLKVTYSLDTNIAEWLEINPDTGNTTVKKTIDREAFASGSVLFKVFATNTNNKKGEDKTRLVITDVNDQPPILTNLPYTKNVTEDITIGSTVYTVEYQDTDGGLNAETSFLFNSGNENGTFRIESKKIILNHTLDYDNGVRQYVLNITARNIRDPFLETSGVLTINVLNADDLGLEFTKKIYQGEIIKGSAVNTPILRVEAKDLDGLNETIQYQILSESNPGNVYAIDSKTGEIAVNAQLELGSRTLVVLAISKKHGSYISLANVTVVAVLNIAFQANVLEGKANVIVMDLTTIEPSFNITGSSFSIQSGNVGSHFEIDSSNRLKVGTKALDQEILSSYSLVIQLTKDGVVRGMATINVKVDDTNDNTPAFESMSYAVTVKEDLSIGSNIIKITARDPDEGLNGTVKYSTTNGQGVFAIDNITGQITLASQLDRETTSSYTLIVKAYDGGSPERSNTTNVTITVEDVNDLSPVITPSIFKVNVTEEVNTGYQVITITASDGDEGQNANVSYSIISGDNGHFKIDTMTGVIKTSARLSHKLNPTYMIVVAAKDNGVLFRSTNCVVIVSVIAVQVNSHKPVFKPTTYIGGVYEDTSDRTTVLRVSAEDGDGGDNGVVQYQLRQTDMFYMHPNTGEMQTMQSFSGKEGQKYELTVQAKDGGQPPKVSDLNADVYVLVLTKDFSVAITSGVRQKDIFANIQEFERALNNLTDGKVFLRSIRPGSDVNKTLVLLNVVNVNSKTEKTYEEVVRTLDSKNKQDLIVGQYKKWSFQYGRPKTAERQTAAEGGLSAVVGAMICLAVMIGIGGIIMIIILLKKKRERERVRKAARVTFNDKPQFIDPIANKSKTSNHIENAQEAQEVIVHMSDENSSVISDEMDSNYINDGYHHDTSDDDNRSREEHFYESGEEVHFGTFFPPPPTEPPPPIPDLTYGHDSEDESVGPSHDQQVDHHDDHHEYMNDVLPPHEDFADHRHENIYSESPTQSVTDSTTNLVDPSSYKNSLLHDPSFGFRALGPSQNNDLSTEL